MDLRITGGWEFAPACRQPDLGASSRDFSDTDRIRKTKGLAGNHRLTPVILGSPTWARTRDLRIDRTGLTSTFAPDTPWQIKRSTRQRLRHRLVRGQGLVDLRLQRLQLAVND